MGVSAGQRHFVSDHDVLRRRGSDLNVVERAAMAISLQLLQGRHHTNRKQRSYSAERILPPSRRRCVIAITYVYGISPHSLSDMYRFTLYWTLVFYVPAFVVCGTYAFLNLSFPPSRRRPRSHRNRPSFPFLEAASYSALPATAGDDIPLQRQQTQHLSERSLRRPPAAKPRHKVNERRSRLTFALLVLLAFLLAGFAGAVLGSAIVGYVLAGLYKSADFNMST